MHLAHRIWSRLFLSTPDPLFSAWESFHNYMEYVGNMQAHFSTWPELGGQGIFGNSIVHIDFFEPFTSTAGLELNGSIFNGQRMMNARTRCPHGNLVLSTQAISFEFDISEVDGISASKSSALYFPTLDDFGKYYIDSIKAPLDNASLEKMKRWREARIFHPSCTDHVSLRLWDGRLFLCNAGGSHHFAGAAYIAKRIGVRVPLQTKLKFIALNELSVQWLISTFVPVAVACPNKVSPIQMVARLAGACYSLEVPEIMHANTSLLLIPRSTQTEKVVAKLTDQGALDLTCWFQKALTQQANQRPVLERRFGRRINMERGTPNIGAPPPVVSNTPCT